MEEIAHAVHTAGEALHKGVETLVELGEVAESANKVPPSLLQRLRRLRNRRVYINCTLNRLLNFILGTGSIVLGAIHLNDCPAQDKLPQCFIIFGSLILYFAILSLLSHTFIFGCSCKTENDEEENNLVGENNEEKEEGENLVGENNEERNILAQRNNGEEENNLIGEDNAEKEEGRENLIKENDEEIEEEDENLVEENNEERKKLAQRSSKEEENLVEENNEERENLVQRNSKEEEKSTWFLLGLIGFNIKLVLGFLTGTFVTICIFTFGMTPTTKPEDHDLKNYCDAALYDTSYYGCIVILSLTSLAILCRCCRCGS